VYGQDIHISSRDQIQIRSSTSKYSTPKPFRLPYQQLNASICRSHNRALRRILIHPPGLAVLNTQGIFSEKLCQRACMQSQGRGFRHDNISIDAAIVVDFGKRLLVIVETRRSSHARASRLHQAAASLNTSDRDMICHYMRNKDDLHNDVSLRQAVEKIDLRPALAAAERKEKSMCLARSGNPAADTVCPALHRKATRPLSLFAI